MSIPCTFRLYHGLPILQAYQKNEALFANLVEAVSRKPMNFIAVLGL